MNKLINEKQLFAEDLPIAFEYLSRNPVAKYLAWDLISQNYQIFFNK